MDRQPGRHEKPVLRHLIGGRRGFAGAAVLTVVLSAAVAVTVHAGAPLSHAPASRRPASTGNDAQQRAVAQPPLRFEPNAGQADGRFPFVGRGSTNLLLAPSEIVLGTGASMRFVGARPDATMAGGQRQVATANYLVGSDGTKWQRGLPTYAEARASGIYQGIDVLYRDAPGGFEYDLLVAPGADPASVQLAYEGAHVRVEGGDLMLSTPQGSELRQHRPVAYQEIRGSRHPVTVDYVLDPGGVRLAVGAYDVKAPLVIDPVIDYSTYLGGSKGLHQLVKGKVGPDGSLYVAGEMENVRDFPTTPGSLMPDRPPGRPDGLANSNDGYVAKFDARGTLLWSTYLGANLGRGSGEGDYADDIAVDVNGDAYVAGRTLVRTPNPFPGSTFPTTPTAYSSCDSRQTLGGLYLVKLDSGGSKLLYGTCLANAGDVIRIAIDGSGRAFLTARAFHPFPLKNGVDGASTDVALLVVDTTKSGEDSLAFSTFFGGKGDQPNGNPGTNSAQGIAVVGNDLVLATITSSPDFPTAADDLCPAPPSTGMFRSFLSRFHVTPSGALELVGSACFGGDLAVAPDSGHLYVAGAASGAGLAPTPNAFQGSPQPGFGAFVAELDLSGPMSSSLRYLSYAGGGGPVEVAPGKGGQVYVAAGSGNTPARGSLPDAGPDPTSRRVQVQEFDTSKSGDESLVSSVSFGGTGYVDVAHDATSDGVGGVWVLGETWSPDFPVTANAFQSANSAQARVFITHLRPSPVIRSLAPDTGPACGGTPVVVTGTRLGTASASIGGVPALGRALSDTSYGIVTGPHAPGPADLTLSDAQGGSDTATFTYTPVADPVVSGVSPGSGSSDGGTTVAISGTSLSCARSVTFGGVAATNIQVLSDTQITAETPPHDPGTVDVSVTTDTGAGLVASPIDAAARFTYVPPPVVVSSITPPCGPLAGGTPVVLRGSGLSGATEVRFGDAAVAPQPDTANSDGALTAASPAVANPTAVAVRVVTPLGTSAPVSFTYPCGAAPGPGPDRGQQGGGADNGGSQPPLAAPPGGGGGTPTAGLSTTQSGLGVQASTNTALPGVGLVSSPASPAASGLATSTGPAAPVVSGATPGVTPVLGAAPGVVPDPEPGGASPSAATRHAMVVSATPSSPLITGLLALGLIAWIAFAGLTAGRLRRRCPSTVLHCPRPQEA